MNNYLTTEIYWDKNRKAFKPFAVKNLPLDPIFEGLLPKGKYEFIEIGGYPGTYAIYFAKKFGYIPTILDYTQYSENIKKLLEFNKIKKYKLYNTDFLNVELKDYDVVASFGFVEHFDNYESIVRKHFEIAKKGGYVIISVPVFSFFQKIARELLWKSEFVDELKSTHNFTIMNSQRLREVVSVYSSEILFFDYVLGSDIWFSVDDPRIRKERKSLAKIFIKVSKILSGRLPSNKFTSPMLLVILKK